MLNGRHTNPTPEVYKVYKVFFFNVVALSLELDIYLLFLY